MRQAPRPIRSASRLHLRGSEDRLGGIALDPLPRLRIDTDRVERIGELRSRTLDGSRRVIRSDHDLARADECHEKLERGRGHDRGVVIEALDVIARKLPFLAAELAIEARALVREETAAVNEN